jgi:lysyl-tRNA synthetase class I
MQVTDITAPLRQVPDEFGTGLSWAEAATEAWLAAARQAGVSAEVQSVHHRDVENQAATVRVNGELYVLQADQGTVTASPAG